MNVDELRAQLMEQGLDDELEHRDPLTIFAEWLALAREASLFNANAMALATVSAEGLPSVRNVLMQGVVDGGFTFYTNHNSEKGRDLLGQPVAQGLFSWLPLERQIRVSGPVVQLSSEASDAYFATRHRGSQLAAVASDQSTEIPDREWLLRRYNVLEAANEGREVERPPHWGGFAIVADRIEFWQGAQHRLHDRVVFERASAEWSTSRLAP